MYIDIPWPLRWLTSKKTKRRTKEYEEFFKMIKELLTSDKVLANWEAGRDTQLYMDDGLAEVASTPCYSIQSITVRHLLSNFH